MMVPAGNLVAISRFSSATSSAHSTGQPPSARLVRKASTTSSRVIADSATIAVVVARCDAAPAKPRPQPHGPADRSYPITRFLQPHQLALGAVVVVVRTCTLRKRSCHKDLHSSPQKGGSSSSVCGAKGGGFQSGGSCSDSHGPLTQAHQGLVLGSPPLNRMSILRMWLRLLRSAISCCVRG